jgi:hypothetical protein
MYHNLALLPWSLWPVSMAFAGFELLLGVTLV